MLRIVVVGGTGYAGNHIVGEAVARGHHVTSISRSLPTERRQSVTYMQGTLLDPQSIIAMSEGADVIVIAASPRGAMAGALRPAIAAIVEMLPDTTRIGVVGGAGGSLVSPGGPRLVDVNFPDEFKGEALEMIAVLDDLKKKGTTHDWFLVHPAGGFGPWNVGERTGVYRTGGDVLVTDDNGDSNISGPDFGVAVLDEIENPAHRGARFTVGY